MGYQRFQEIYAFNSLDNKIEMQEISDTGQGVFSYVSSLLRQQEDRDGERFDKQQLLF